MKLWFIREQSFFQKRVRIVRWTLLVFVVFELDRVRCTMKFQYWWKLFFEISSWVYFFFLFFFYTCDDIMCIFSPAIYRESTYIYSAFIDSYLLWKIIRCLIKISKEIYYRHWKINRNVSRIFPALLRLVRILTEIELNKNMGDNDYDAKVKIILKNLVNYFSDLLFNSCLKFEVSTKVSSKFRVSRFSSFHLNCP